MYIFFSIVVLGFYYDYDMVYMFESRVFRACNALFVRLSEAQRSVCLEKGFDVGIIYLLSCIYIYFMKEDINKYERKREQDIYICIFRGGGFKPTYINMCFAFEARGQKRKKR